MNKKNRIVLLTGAGFSSLVGLKTLKSIVASIQVPVNDADEIVEIVKDTWKVIKGQKGEKTTLEDLIARLKHYIEIANLINTDFVFREKLQPNMSLITSGQFRLKWEQALSYSFRLILDNYGPNNVNTNCEGFDFIIDSIKLLSNINGDVLHIYTTNYDCLLNVIADKNTEIKFLSHINNKNGSFEESWHTINEKANKSKASVYIHRLHGCIGWFSDKRSPYGVEEVYGTGNHLKIEDPEKLNQMAIKLISDEKIGFQPAFSSAFGEFRKSLETCEKLLIWGHSCKDLEVMRTIINTLENRKGRPFYIYFIDPYLEKEQVINNILQTIKEIPKNESPNLNTISRIDWVVGDGYKDLYNKINSLFNKEAYDEKR